jgi:hypothetical protein
MIMIWGLPFHSRPVASYMIGARNEETPGAEFESKFTDVL